MKVIKQFIKLLIFDLILLEFDNFLFMDFLRVGLEEYVLFVVLFQFFLQIIVVVVIEVEFIKLILYDNCVDYEEEIVVMEVNVIV